MHAAAVVLPLPRRVNGTSVFGKTLETVLNERPCRVIIESSPAEAHAAPRGGEGPGGGAVTHRDAHPVGR